MFFQVLDNHVIRYIPPEEYRHYPRYKWNRWNDRYAGVVVGALSMHPFQVKSSSRGSYGSSIPELLSASLYFSKEALIEIGCVVTSLVVGCHARALWPSGAS